MKAFLPLDDRARKSAPGSFAKLNHGQTHFQWHRGPNSKQAKILVLVHGFSTPSFVWRGILPQLLQAGYTILTYDLFGRGWSDRPNLKYSLDLFTSQLSELLKSQKVTQPVYLVGYSMGCLIAAHFAAKQKQSTHCNFFIAPAGLGTKTNIPFLLKLPIIGNILADTVMAKRLLREMALPSGSGKALPDLVERYQEQMQYTGYMRALRSTLLHTPLGEADSIYQELAEAKIPAFALWGSNDTVTPPRGAERIKAAMPQCEIRITDGPTHSITYSHPEIVAEAIIDHGKRQTRHD